MTVPAGNSQQESAVFPGEQDILSRAAAICSLPQSRDHVLQSPDLFFFFAFLLCDPFQRVFKDFFFTAFRIADQLPDFSDLQTGVPVLYDLPELFQGSIVIELVLLGACSSDRPEQVNPVIVEQGLDRKSVV